MNEPLPEWATAEASDAFEIGAQMRTRDGRRTGNGVIVSTHGRQDEDGIMVIIITDYGNKLTFTQGEVMSAFYPPAWLMDISKHIGVQKFNEENPNVVSY